jgi:hypothetical protein
MKRYIMTSARDLPADIPHLVDADTFVAIDIDKTGGFCIIFVEMIQEFKKSVFLVSELTIYTHRSEMG